jgi:predicted nucleic acid-binding protein
VGLLIDSTVLIHAERRGRTVDQLIQDIMSRFGDVELALSVMSAGELFHGCWRADSPARRAQREEYVESVLSAIPAVPISLEVIRVFGQIDAKLRTAGERIATSDLLIACTALTRGDEIVTGNIRHFDHVPGLVIHELAL